MLALDLYNLLNSPIADGSLRDAIAPAMPDYRRGRAEGGRSCPVVIHSDGSLLVVAASHLVVLCEAYLQNRIDDVELEYLVTALELGSDFKFVSEVVEECAFFLSSPVANGPTATESVPAVLRILREHAA